MKQVETKNFTDVYSQEQIYDKMLEKYKVFVRGSAETKKVLEEISQKLDVNVNNWTYSDNPSYQFGKCPLDNDNHSIWFTDHSNPKYFITYGYKEVTPQQFREIWLGEKSPKKENEPKPFCCKGCEKLREVCQRLAEEGFINHSISNFARTLFQEFYFLERDHQLFYITNKVSHGEIVSPEEFYKRIAGKPWEEKKKYLGFIGDSNVEISFLPKEIKNPKHLKGTGRACIFYVENNELTYCVIGKEPKDVSFEIVSYLDFLMKLHVKSGSEQPLTPDYCFKSKQETKETNLVQTFVKNPSENFLHLSEEKPLKIIL